MMREPWFWRQNTPLARIAATALLPLAKIYDGAQRLRWASARPTLLEKPVICIGNATLGGVGKTPCALMAHEILRAQKIKAQFQTRGYGGTLEGPVIVDPMSHQSADVGDEALLLAQAGQVWVARNRAAGVSAALNAGAEAIIMDDGFQNPNVRKDCAILVIDARDPAGNGRVFPAGPLREPLTRAIARADIVILNGPKASADAPILEVPDGKPIFRAWLESKDAPAPRPVVAFCGIGDPPKFFTFLAGLGFKLEKEIAFPDHHQFSAQELSHLSKLAEDHDATLITTEKDFVRLPASFRDNCLTMPVTMTVDDPAALSEAIFKTLDGAMRAP